MSTVQYRRPLSVGTMIESRRRDQFNSLLSTWKYVSARDHAHADIATNDEQHRLRAMVRKRFGNSPHLVQVGRTWRRYGTRVMMPFSEVVPLLPRPLSVKPSLQASNTPAKCCPTALRIRSVRPQIGNECAIVGFAVMANKDATRFFPAAITATSNQFSYDRTFQI